MALITKCATKVLGVGLITGWCACNLLGEQGDAPNPEVVIARIRELGVVNGRSWQLRQEQMELLAGLEKSVESTWKSLDQSTYARLALEIARTLGSADFRDPRQHYLAQRVSFRALEIAEDIPIDVECDLLGYVQGNVGEDGKPLGQAEWIAVRKRRAEAWMHAWLRIERTIDPKWDRSDSGYRNVPPPPETGLPAGVSPEAIKDKDLRAKYEADMLANKAKLLRNREQIQARRLRESWIPWAKRFLIGSYIDAPDRTEELQALLAQYVADAKDRTQVLDAVKNKKLPEELEFRITTQKADAHPPQTQPAQ